MEEYPILFTSEMVKAILEDRKTVTRRMGDRWGKVKAGDGLWVKESYWEWEHTHLNVKCGCINESEARSNRIYYTDNEYIGDLKHNPLWRLVSARYMPRWASRITLEVTKDVYKQPLWDMTESDCLNEGVRDDFDGKTFYPAGYKFKTLWDSINGKKYPWSGNPEVWVIEFRRLRCQ